MINTDISELPGLHAVRYPEALEEAEERFLDPHILLSQIERILHSEELRSSAELRRLLRFLAEKSVSGEADELKEYTVAVDGLGKPSSYDPRHNSAVRIQLIRLRQKLGDYYRREGANDRILISIPKGHFTVIWEMRDEGSPGTVRLKAPEARHEDRKQASGKINLRRWRTEQYIPSIITAGALLALATATTYNNFHPSPARTAASSYSADWNADMEDLWGPFVDTSRPMVVAIEDPLWIELDGKRGVYYRDKTLNSWNDVTSSPAVSALRSALKNQQIAPSRYYTAFGEVDSSFLLARTLGSHVHNIRVVKSSDLSIRELADNNVLFVGIENIYFTNQIAAAPIEAPLQPVIDGIRNVHPKSNEPAMFFDEFSSAPNEEGVVYALVTHVPGPLGGNDVESFTSNHSAGYVAAVKAFTDPQFVSGVTSQLKQVAGGKMPRYYQVLLKVKYTNEVPTEITYILARELRVPGRQ